MYITPTCILVSWALNTYAIQHLKLSSMSVECGNNILIPMERFCFQLIESDDFFEYGDSEFFEGKCGLLLNLLYDSSDFCTP